MLQGKQIDLLLCGSPCKDMSLINIGGKVGINGNKSSLFFKCSDILKIVKPKFFLFENVASMTNADRDVITNTLGVDPIKIDSQLVSAQERRRYYWTNIPNVIQPKDRCIKLEDILEKNPLKEENWSTKKTEFVNRKRGKMYVRVNGEKSLPITARGYAAWNTQFINIDENLRDLTTLEYRRLQTIPDWYNFGNLIKSKITDLIGDGWTINVIIHILKNIK